MAERTHRPLHTHTHTGERTHRHAHTHNRGTTQTLTHRQAYTHRGTHTCTQAIHSQRSVHIGERTHRHIHTDVYTHTHTLRNEYAAERTQAFQKYGNKCYLKKQKANTKKDKRKKKAKPSHNLWKLQLWRQGPASLAEREAGPFVEQILLLTVTFQSSVCGPGRFLFSVLFTLSINEQGRGGLRQCLIG